MTEIQGKSNLVRVSEGSSYREWAVSISVKTAENIVEPRFIASWTITSEKCTRAHVQENKKYTSIYISLYIKTFLEEGV